MKSGIRLATFAVLCFTVPILCATQLGPQFFSYTKPSSESASHSRARMSSPPASDDATSIEPMAANRTVISDVRLDPSPDRYFVASVAVNISSLPRVGKRQKLMGKYSSGSKANPGWAVAVRRLSTSTRPEVYYQGANGKGGWYTFERFRFRKSKWYAITLVARAGDFMSLYVQELEHQAATAVAISDAEDEGEYIDASKPVFLGGYPLGDVGTFATDAPLEFAPRQVDAGDFRGAVRSVMIASPLRIPRTPDRIAEVLMGGPDGFAGRTDHHDIALWVQDDGLDHSMTSRRIDTEQAKLQKP